MKGLDSLSPGCRVQDKPSSVVPVLNLHTEFVVKIAAVPEQVDRDPGSRDGLAYGIRHAVDNLVLSQFDLPAMLGQLHHRAVALDCCDRHLRLKARCMVPARSPAHALS